MAEEEIGVRLSLKDRKKFSDDAQRAAKDLEKIGDKADRVDKAGRRMGGGLGVAKKGLGGLTSAAKVGGVALAAATTAVIAFGIQGFNSLNRIEVIAAQTNAVLKSTGGVANTTRSEIDEMAGSLEALTGIEAESITQGQNLLLTFTKVRNEVGKGNDVFDRATKSMVDMGVALGTDASGAALQLGKALNDPIKGVGALSRAGVSFTQQQKAQIKALQESGDMLGAQKMILSELEVQFGGSAKAYGSTTKGLIDRTKHLFGTLQEGIVSEFTPGVTGGLQSVHDGLSDLVDSSETWLPALGDRFREVTSAAMEMGSSLLESFRTEGARGVVSDLDAAAGAGGLLTDTFDALASAAGSLGTIWTNAIMPALRDFNAVIPEGLRPIELVASGLGWIADNAGVLRVALVALVGTYVAWRLANIAANIVLGIQTGLQKANTTTLKAHIVQSKIAKAAIVLWTAAQWLLNAAMSANPIALVVLGIVALVAIFALAWKHSETFRNIVTGAFTAVKNAAASAFNWVKNNWPLILAILTGPIGLAVLAISKNWDTIVGFVTGLPGRIATAASGMWDGVKDAFKSALNWIIRAWNNLDFTLPSTTIAGVKIGGGTIGMPDIPELHKGGTTTTGGAVNMRPGEEMVILPPAASVVPMSDDVRAMAASMMTGEGVAASKQPLVLQVVLDRKVIAEAVYDHAGDKMART